MKPKIRTLPLRKDRLDDFGDVDTARAVASK
jgi:hypothetical protein